MIIAPESSTRKSEIQTFEQANNQHSLTDYGAWKGMAASFSNGFHNNMTMTLASWLKKHSLADKDDPRVTQEEFDASHAPRLGLSYQNDENKAQLDWRIHQAAVMAKNNEYASGQDRFVRNMIGGFAGGMLTDPLAFLPVTLPSRAAKLAQLHKLAGNRTAASYHQASSTFKNVLAVNAAYEAPYAFMMNDIGVQEYTYDHLKMAAAMNLGFAGLFAGVHGYVSGRAAARNNHLIRQDEVLTKAFENDDPRAALETAYDSDNFVINRMLDENPELRDYASGRTEGPLTAEQDRLVTAILYMHRLHSEAKFLSIQAARKLADRATKESATKLLGVQRRQSKRLTDLVMNGKNADTLTRTDATLLKELGYDISDFHQVHPTKKSIVPNVGFIPEPAKVYGDKLYAVVSEGQKIMGEHIRVSALVDDPDIPKEKIQERLDFLQSKFDEKVQEARDMLGQNYSELLKDTQAVVNNIFFGKDEAIKVEAVSETKLKGVDKKGTMSLGYIRPDMENLVSYMNEPFFFFARSFNEEARISGDKASKGKAIEYSDAQLRDMFDGGKYTGDAQPRAFISVFRTLMHETVHHLEYIDKDAYNKIIKAAKTAGGPLKSFRSFKTIYKTARKAGYKRVAALDEIPSLLVEFAIAQPAFWQTLKKTDPALYSKMAETLDFLAVNLYNTLSRYNNIPLNVKIKATQDPVKLASEISKTLTEIRNSTETQVLLKFAMEEAEVLSGVFDPFVKGIDDAELSVAHLNTKESKAGFENRSKAQEHYDKDPLSFVDDAVADLLGGDETVMPTLLSLSNLPLKKLPPAINTFVTNMEEKGHVWMTNDLAQEMVMLMQASRKRGREVAKIILKNKEFGPVRDELAGLANKGLPLELAQRIGYILLDETGGSSKQIARVHELLQREAHAAVLRRMHDASTAESLRNLVNNHRSAQNRVDQLKTFMDGSRRKAVTIGPSLQTYKTLQKQKDQNPLMNYLIENDLLDIFLGEDMSHYMSSYVNNTIGNKDLAAVYGKELKEASVLFHRDIMEALHTGEIPKKWQGVKVWEELIQVIRNTNKAQLGEMNLLGINIRDRKGFLGYSMVYDRAYVKSMGYEAFEAKMLEMIDMRETIKAHGGLMAERPEAKTSKLNDAGKHKKFNKETFLRGLYEEIVEGEFVNDPDINNPSALGGYRKAAKIVFKPEHRIDALIQFGNRKNMGRFMLEQIAQRSDNIALVKHVGHDANTTLTGLIDPRATAASKRVAKATIDQVTGKLDTPVDASLSSMFKNVRQVQNIAMLGGAGFSSLSDIPLVWATLQYLGVGSEGMGAYFSRYKDAVSAKFKGDNKAMSEWFRSQGAAFDLYTRNMAQRVVTDDTGVGGKISTANDFMFELNFLNRLTGAHQQLFVDMLTSGLAEQLTSKKMNPVTRERLNEFGFTDKEIARLANYVEETPDGVFRIGPSSIKGNAKLQEKLSAFMNQYMREGVIEPDVGAQALSRLGLQAGTMGGETARLALQYSSFMIAMGRVIYRRFLYGYSGDNKTAAFRNAHMFAFLGMSLAAAYLSTVLKDLSRFKEPMNPLDMTEQEWMRLVRQSGLLSYYEPFFNAAQFGTDAAFGPAVGTATDIASLDFGDAVEPYTGQYLPVVGPIIKQTAHTAHEIIFNFVGEETEKADKAARQLLDNK